MPQVSIVIPSYNHARFVREAIASVAAQTHRDIELIVVDDGSSDGSPDVIRSALADASSLNARLIEQPNRGAHAAIERGVAAARNDAIAILNSDDRFAPERIGRMLAEAPDVGDFLIFSKARMIDASGLEHPSDSRTVVGYRHGLYEASRCPTVGFALLRNNVAVSSGNLLFTKALYRKLGGFADFELASDWDFLLRALFYVEPIFVPEELLDYRTHGGNTRLGVTAESANEQGREILNRYFAACDEQIPLNPLAPCEQHWPVYFDLFVSRYHAWFGSGPIRDWMDSPPEIIAADVSAKRWRSWSSVVDFERVDDCDYLTSDPDAAGARAALALAREILVSAAHPLAQEEGPGNDTLARVLERQQPGRPSFTRWPFASGVDRSVAPGLAPRTASESPALASLAIGRARAAIGTIAAMRWLRLLRDAKALRDSGLFDARHYRSQGPGLGAMSPAWHYLFRGASRGFDPHPLFDSEFYLKTNQDVASWGQNPLLHYLRWGGREGRNPTPLFDSSFYLYANPDVRDRGWNPLVHYVRHGQSEGRRAHPRFDADFYTEQYASEMTPGADPLAHYLHSGRARGFAMNTRQRMRLVFDAAPTRSLKQGRDDQLMRSIRSSRVFDDDFYISACGSDADRALIEDPLRHFLVRGSAEGVRFCPDRKLERRMLRLDIDDASHQALRYLGNSAAEIDSPRSVGIHVSSLGNSFFTEIAEFLAQALREAGARVHLLDEGSADHPDTDCDVIVAPHEYFLLGRGLERLNPEFLARSTLWLAEQPGSEFFAMCMWFARHARAVLDINPRTALLWHALGFRARAFPLGHMASFAAYSDRREIRSASIRSGQSREVREYHGGVDDPWSDRPLDVFCNAVLTDRRDRFFAQEAQFFSGLRCALFMPTPHRPLSREVASALDSNDATALGQRAKVQLNLHRGDFPYFEWHRVVVRGIWQKSIVVSEPCLTVSGFTPNEHYVECELSEIPQKLDYLLNTSRGRSEAEAMRKRAFERLVGLYSMKSIATAFLREESTWSTE